MLTQITPDELTISNNRDYRDHLAGHVDVLDKVKVLTMLPDDIHVTVEMTANYYEVNKDIIKKVIQRHRDELNSDGIKVLSGEALEKFVRDTMSPSKYGNLLKARFLTLLPRRAVLRIGMLLRDSEVAKRIRTYLLNVEQIAKETAPSILQQAVEMGLPTTFSMALRRLADEIDRNEKLIQQLAELNNQVVQLAPKAEKYEEIYSAKNNSSVEEVAKLLNFKGMGRNNLFKFLREKGVFYYVKHYYDYVNMPYQKYVNAGYFRIIYKTKYKMNNDYSDYETIKIPIIVVTAKGIEFIRKLLMEAGYRPQQAS